MTAMTNRRLSTAIALAALAAGCRTAAAPVTSPGKGVGTATTAAARTATAAAAREATTGDEPWRSAPPSPGAARAPVLPAFKTAKLKNGLTVMVSDQRALLPLVSFELVSKGGATVDGPDKAGLATLTYAMLEEGAGTRDALQFSDALADLGATFNAASDRDRGAATIGGLARSADAMVALLADAVLRPRLAPADFERRRAQAVAALTRGRGSPQGLAFEALPALVYGAKHPYGHPPMGTVETVQRLTLADVKAAKAKLIAPANSALVAAGAITLEEAVALAEKHFGAWKAPAPKPPRVPEVAAKPRRELVLVDKPGAAQTMVMVARPIFGRGSPEEFPLTVANELLGGAFSSRLNMNLREDKGYTYGAGSQAAYRQGAGAFLAYGAIRRDATAPALGEIMAELAGMSGRPPTAEEVGHAKATIQRSIPGAFERTAAIAGAAAAIFVDGLPLDYYVHLGDRYAAVTPAEVEAAARRWFTPALMQVLLVGDAKTVAEPLRALKLGTVTVRPVPPS